MYQKILLAYYGSTESQQALLNCKDLSQWEHAKVHLLSVMPHDVLATFDRNHWSSCIGINNS